MGYLILRGPSCIAHAFHKRTASVYFDKGTGRNAAAFSARHGRATPFNSAQVVAVAAQSTKVFFLSLFLICVTIMPQKG